MTVTIAFGTAVVALLLWAVLAFVVAIPSGWVHVLLAIGATLIAVGIVKQPPRA